MSPISEYANLIEAQNRLTEAKKQIPPGLGPLMALVSTSLDLVTQTAESLAEKLEKFGKEKRHG